MEESKINHYPNLVQSMGITGIVIMSIILFAPINIIFNNLIEVEFLIFFYYFLSLGTSFLIIFFIRKRENKIDNKFKFSIDEKTVIIVVSVVVVVLIHIISSGIGGLIPMPEMIEKMFVSLGEKHGLFSFLLMVILAPFFEELIFRGIMLDGLLKNYSPEKSILISSILFGLVHLNPWQFVTGFFMGIFVGWIYYKTKSVMLAIILHASVNLSGFLLKVFDIFDSQIFIEIFGGILNLFLAINGLMLLIAACIYCLNKEFKKK